MTGGETLASAWSQVDIAGPPVAAYLAVSSALSIGRGARALYWRVVIGTTGHSICASSKIFRAN